MPARARCYMKTKKSKNIFDMAVSSGETIGGNIEKKKSVRKLFDW